MLRLWWVSYFWYVKRSSHWRLKWESLKRLVFFSLVYLIRLSGLLKFRLKVCNHEAGFTPKQQATGNWRQIAYCLYRNDSDITFKIIAQWETIRFESNIAERHVSPVVLQGLYCLTESFCGPSCMQGITVNSSDAFEGQLTNYVHANNTVCVASRHFHTLAITIVSLVWMYRRYDIACC
jgi:hypothetical protein